MNSSLVISGYALYIFMGVFFMLAVGCIFYGCAYIKEARKREKIQRKYSRLYDDLEMLKEKYRKATFKVPEIDMVKNDKRK